MNETTILVIDDDPVILATTSRILQAHYRVLASISGERALKIAASKPQPDLILLDVMIPDMDGYTVMSRLYENPITRDIPVIFVTAMEADVDEEKGLVLGAVDYLTKPIRPAILLARVKAHLTLKQARDFLHDKNAYLESEVERRMEENQQIQNVSIRALAHLAEMRDLETGDHLRRTQSYVYVLAKHLHSHPHFSTTITDKYIDQLVRSAPLHDIGKVGIPDHILLKQGRLTDEQWAVMQTHAAIGAQAIELARKDVKQPIDFLTLATEIAHWHHERWDGNGYPDGLKGNQIPISARLMALADVFDALISRRVYKQPIPFGEAKEMIAAGRNSQFDPDIVDAFLAEYDQFVSIAYKYQAGTSVEV